VRGEVHEGRGAVIREGCVCVIRERRSELGYWCAACRTDSTATYRNDHLSVPSSHVNLSIFDLGRFSDLFSPCFCISTPTLYDPAVFLLTPFTCPPLLSFHTS
jgi:hypothetical protein